MNYSTTAILQPSYFAHLGWEIEGDGSHVMWSLGGVKPPETDSYVAIRMYKPNPKSRQWTYTLRFLIQRGGDGAGRWTEFKDAGKHRVSGSMWRARQVAEEKLRAMQAAHLLGHRLPNWEL